MGDDDDITVFCSSLTAHHRTLVCVGFLPSDDYYDTEDPSVNLHEFIINSLQAQK